MAFILKKPAVDIKIVNITDNPIVKALPIPVPLRLGKRKMTYPVLNGTQIGNDLTQIIVYVNSVTYGWFVPSILFSFFMIVLISSSVLQQRYSGNIKFEQAFAAS